MDTTVLVSTACFLSFTLASWAMYYILSNVKKILSEGGMLDFESTSPEQAQENMDMIEGMALGGLMLLLWLYVYYKVKLLLRK